MSSRKYFCFISSNFLTDLTSLREEILYYSIKKIIIQK